MRENRENLRERLNSACWVLLLIALMQPVYIFNVYFAIACYAVLTLILVITGIKSQSKLLIVEKDNILYAIFSVISVVVYYFLPREYWSFNLNSLVFVSFSILLIFTKINRKLTLVYLNKAFILLSILSLLSLLIYALKIPSLIELTFTSSENNLSYKSYYFAFLISSQELDIFGFQLFRNSSIFAEPGHFAVYLGLISLMSWRFLGTTQKSVYLITMATTFSAIGYIFILAMLLSNFLVIGQLRKRYLLKSNLIVISIFAAVILIFYEPLMKVVVTKFEASSVQDIIISRAVNGISVEDILNNNPLFGLGNSAVSKMGFVTSDFLAFVLRYGLLGVVNFIAFVYLIRRTFGNERTEKLRYLILVIMIVGIGVHRSWMIDKLFLLSLAYLSSKQYGLILSKPR